MWEAKYETYVINILRYLGIFKMLNLWAHSFGENLWHIWKIYIEFAQYEYIINKINYYYHCSLVVMFIVQIACA